MNFFEFLYSRSWNKFLLFLFYPELNIPTNHDLTMPNEQEPHQQPWMDPSLDHLPPSYEQCTPNLSSSRSAYPWIDPGLNLEPIHNDHSIFSGNVIPSDGAHQQDNSDQRMQIDEALETNTNTSTPFEGEMITSHAKDSPSDIPKNETTDDDTLKYNPVMSMGNTLQGDSNMNPVEPGDISSNDLVFPTNPNSSHKHFSFN